MDCNFSGIEFKGSGEPFGASNKSHVAYLEGSGDVITRLKAGITGVSHGFPSMLAKSPRLSKYLFKPPNPN